MEVVINAVVHQSREYHTLMRSVNIVQLMSTSFTVAIKRRKSLGGISFVPDQTARNAGVLF